MRYLAVSSGLITLVVVSGGAASSQPAADRTAAATGDFSATALGEVVVTSQKRAESVQKVPETVTVESRAVIARDGVKDLFQAITLVPGAIFSRAPDDGLGLTFRGLGTAARPQAFDQSIALFTDGVFNGKGRLYTAGFFDLDRIEFIEGTQSTLLGKNASLGAISEVSRQPGDVDALEARAGFEAVDGGYILDAAGDHPLNDKTTVRLAIRYNDLNGWIHNDITGSDSPEHRDFGVRAIIRSEITDKLKVTASYQYGDNRQIGTNFQLIGAIPPAYGAGVLGGDVRQFTTLTASGDTSHNTRSNIAYIKADIDLGRVNLVSQTSYVNYNTDNSDNMGFSSDSSVNFTRTEHYNQVTQELRLESPGGQKFDYIVGGFFLYSRWNSLEGQIWAVPGFPPPPSPISGQLFNGPFYNHFVQTSYAYSGFASGTYHFTDALRVVGGVRLTKEDKNVVFGRTAVAPFTIWNQIANPPFAPTPLMHNSNFVDGNVSLQYDLAADVLAYASYGHGSKSGGFAETNSIAVPPSALVNGLVPAALVAVGSAIKDESTNNYEVGLKTTLLDHRLRLNIAGFWTDVRNFQDTVFTGGALGFITFNGPAESKGMEIETGLRVTPDLTLNGAFNYADATGVIQPIDALGVPEVNANGDPIFKSYRRAQAPKYTANVSADYSHKVTNDLTMRFGGAVHYRSSMFNQRQEEFPSAALTTLDLSLGIESEQGKWGIDIVAKNVTNDLAQDFASPSVDPRFATFYGAYLAGSNPATTVLISAHVQY